MKPVAPVTNTRIILIFVDEKLISCYKPNAIVIVFGLANILNNITLNVAESVFVVAEIGLGNLLGEVSRYFSELKLRIEYIAKTLITC
jgi:hypothetical protein